MRDAYVETVPVSDRNDQDYPGAIIAADVVDTGNASSLTTGVWSLRDSQGAYPILGLTSDSRKVTNWGAAAQPGAPIMSTIDHMAAMSQTEIVLRCVEEQK